jgi:hypothetical protein
MFVSIVSLAVCEACIQEANKSNTELCTYGEPDIPMTIPNSSHSKQSGE